MSVSIDLNYVRSKALLYSVIVHALVLSLFIFVVPLKKEPHKPALVFFGALFQNADLIGISSKQLDHSAALGIPVTTYKSVSQPPYDDRAVPKPIYFEVVQPKPKITPKVFEASKKSENGANLTTVEDLHLPTVPAYKPLKFQTK